MSAEPRSSLADARLSRRSAARLLGGAGAAALAANRLAPLSHSASAAADSSASSTQKESTTMSQATPTTDSGLTVALVHGAFADSSSWTAVIELLQGAGVNVTAIPNELRSVSGDAAYVASALNQIPGPVLLVGHSYGGAVITNAGSKASNVVGLVYVSAFAPDEGESLASIETGSKDSVLVTALVPRQYPTGNGSETATEFLIDPAKVKEAFAGDLSESQKAVIGATQRTISELSFTEATTSPAWKTLPSWAVIATGDKAAGTDVLRTMAERAGATITEVDASHVVMISQPQAVTDVIMTAIAAVS
jgi:pimeloyl-ACP methyl ester carboxylesterase